MSNKKFTWYKIADNAAAINWQENNLSVVEAAGKKITLIQFKNEVFACAYKCPHASGILADGFVDATGNIVCPLHRYRFNIQNGRNTSGEGYYLKTYPIESREDGIYIGFEENNFFSWL